MAKSHARRLLAGSLREGAVEIPIIGFTCWWTVRNVDLSQAEFIRMLTAAGISTVYARTHNYRSAFTRALHSLEEKRIIRQVEETNSKLVYQFTAEETAGHGDNKRLEYDLETIIEVDKNAYRKDGNFAAAIVKGRADIKKKVVELYEQEKVRYNSNDITRYVQKILNDRADFIPLRENGSVYFVPAAHQDTMERVIRLVNGLNDGTDDNQRSSMDFFPVPNLNSARARVGAAFNSEAEAALMRLEAEVEEVEAGDKKVTDKWSEMRVSRIRNILRRIEGYSDVLKTDALERLNNGFAALEKRIAPGRKLDLEPVAVGTEEEEDEA